MEKDPRKLDEEIEVERICSERCASHDEALLEISKKVDEKLSKISGYDERIEKELEEIRELRRLEKAEIERTRDARRQQHPKREARRAEKVSAERELAEKAAAQREFAEKVAAEKILAEKVAAAKILAEQILAEKAAAQKAEAEQAAAHSPAAQADLEVAQAVDLFFDTVAEIEEEKKKKPSRKLDEGMDAFFRVVKVGFTKLTALTKELHHTRKTMDAQSHLSHEKRVAGYRHVWGKHLVPLARKWAVFQNWLSIGTARLLTWSKDKAADGWVVVSLLWARLRCQLEKIYDHIMCGLEYAEHHKLKMFRYFAGGIVCIAMLGVVVANMTAYEYIYNGKVLGMVKNQEDVYKTVDAIGGKLSESLNADIEIDKEKDITFRRVIGVGLAIDHKDDVLNNLTYMKSLKAKGYAIVADNREICILQSKAAAQGILDDIVERYSKGGNGVEYKSIGFAQNVEIKEINTELGQIQSTDKATKYMLTGAVEKKVHVVQKGQTFNAIAKSYGMKPAQLSASNPGVNPAKLKIDQELILTQDCPVLTVQTTEVITYTAAIPYEIGYEETDKIYKGDTKVKLKGVNGKREIVAEVVRNNGVEVSRSELSSNIISQPTKQLVLKGTKAKPRTVATGSFQYPVRGARISSRYGSRWGRTHTGVDLAVSKGTKIVAADGGTVSFAGYKGSLGYLVIINHGNGKETYYAHCSKLAVSRGDKVYKGQYIANVGSTGRSTGPHCHFEVRVNGTPKNPMNYI